MNFQPNEILWNKSVAQCRVIGRQGGLVAGRNRRRRAALAAAMLDEADEIVAEAPIVETMAQATARIDALCPWLRGVQIRTRPRPTA